MAKTSAPEVGARPAYRGPANLSGKVAIVTGGTQGLGEVKAGCSPSAARRGW